MKEFQHANFTRILETAAIPARLQWLVGKALAEPGEPYNATDFINPAWPYARLIEAGTSDNLQFLFYETTEGPLIAAKHVRPLIVASVKLEKFCIYSVARGTENAYVMARTSLKRPKKSTYEFSRKVDAIVAETVESTGWVPILRHAFVTGRIEFDRCGNYQSQGLKARISVGKQ